jgi:hypothetical protein
MANPARSVVISRRKADACEAVRASFRGARTEADLGAVQRSGQWKT